MPIEFGSFVAAWVADGERNEGVGATGTGGGAGGDGDDDDGNGAPTSVERDDVDVSSADSRRDDPVLSGAVAGGWLFRSDQK